jgi:hypothetical protein
MKWGSKKRRHGRSTSEVRRKRGRAGGHWNRFIVCRASLRMCLLLFLLLCTLRLLPLPAAVLLLKLAPGIFVPNPCSQQMGRRGG